MSTPSIKDVAKLAGVSTATVSRALNKADSVSADTSDTVFKAAKEVGYRINHSARSLRLQRTGAIAVLIPNVSNPFFSNILAGIESVMTDSNINVLVLDSQGQGDIADYLTSQRADGIICLDGELRTDSSTNESSMLNLPVVFACEWPSAGSSSSVRSDNTTGALLAVEHLVSLGHTKIGHVAGPVENVLTAERRNATIQALDKAGLLVKSDWFFEGDFSLDSGAEAARQWFAMEEKPTALFCASDLMAIGFIAELKENGVSVPEDISVIGFDDIDIARYYIPKLTTIRQHTRELGETAARALLEKLHGFDTKSVSKLLEVELVVRGSTAKKSC